MDLTRYTELRNKGKIELKKDGERYYLEVGRYDVYTGELLYTEEIDITVEDVQAERARLNASRAELAIKRDNLNTLIADAQAL